MDIRSLITIHSAENTVIELELAGIGNRVFALLLDFVTMAASFVLILMCISLLSNLSLELGKSLFNLIVVGALLFAFAFHFFQEWLWKGRTLGKRLLHIRVVRNNGQAIGFWEAFGRNILRFVDVYCFAIGFFPMLISKREKRFGDFLVGTLVINDQRLSKKPLVPPSTPPGSVSEDKAGYRLTPEEQELLQTYLTKQSKLLSESRKALESDLKAYFQQRLHLSEAEAQEMLLKPGL